MADTVHDQDATIMKVCLKRVEGINEPVKLVCATGFAVGASSNAVYTWSVDYELPPEDSEEQRRLDGAEEESKENVAAMV